MLNETTGGFDGARTQTCNPMRHSAPVV